MFIRSSVLAFLVVAGAWAQSPAPFDPAIFKSPPAEYRGHAMWNFNLTTLNDRLSCRASRKWQS